MESSRTMKIVRPTMATTKQTGDEAGSEPVVFLALVEHDLQRADGDDEQAEAPVVDADALFADRGEIRRVFDQRDW